MLQNEMEMAEALKSIARNEQIKEYVQESSELNLILKRAAQRFVTGETRDEAIVKAKELMAKGYLVSLEYIGENTRTEQECVSAKDEFITLIRSVGQYSIQSIFSLDLSHIGMVVDHDLAYHQLVELAKEARSYGLTLMISMKRARPWGKVYSK